jgi:hypothetical protein
MEVSKLMAMSSILPQALRGKPADVFITIMYGQELGMTPMQSILGIYVVNGRPGLSGQTWLARIRQAGHRMYVPCVTCGRPKGRDHGPNAGHNYVADHDEKHCTVTIVRRDSDDEHTETFTWADAERAKLTKKDVWVSWPKRMLLWRATTNCATVICPEVALGFEMTEAMPEAIEKPTLAQVAAERTDRQIADTVDAVVDVESGAAEVEAALAELDRPLGDEQGLLPDDPDLFVSDAES